MSNYRKQSIPAPANGRNAERAYGAEIRYAKLCHNEKALLRFYADVFYWEKGQCSEWSVHRISAHIGWTPKTTKGARDRLEELGWIVVHKRGYNKTQQIEVSYGSNDPRYDELGCSKWWKPEGAGSGGPLEVTIPIKGNQPVESDNYFEDQMLYQPLASAPVADKVKTKREVRFSEPGQGFESNSNPQTTIQKPTSEGGWNQSNITEW